MPYLGEQTQGDPGFAKIAGAREHNSLNRSAIVMRVYISDEPTGRLALVFELMEMNLYELIKGILSINEAKKRN